MSSLEVETGLDALAARLKALANEKRLRLLDFLRQPRHAEEVASELGVARQTAHEHLQVLVEAGFVERIVGGSGGPGAVRFALATRELFALQEDLAARGAEPSVPEGRQATVRVEPSGLQAGARGPRLVMVKGRRVGQARALQGEGPWTIGREATSFACLDYDPFVSLRHAEVRNVGGELRVVDLASKNGTTVDWRPLPRGGWARIENGAVIGVGKTLLVLRTTPDAQPQG
ncbi:MAG TPA: helix-turn-helix domain-containing protein [Candidatus Thermoplasmatota archaeon]|nr:helix-turn-helix domain-containing protein [Candidatus Thermoplasmatota archaeon]